jgi:hypothetical protein
LLPNIVTAQKIKLIASSEQHWYGGVAGHSGVNYSFTIEYAGFSQPFLPDTIWIDHSPIALNAGNTKLIPAKNTARLQINVRTSKDDYADRYPIQGNEPKRTYHIPEYKGAALLSYHCSGRQAYFGINKIITHLPAQNYP